MGLGTNFSPSLWTWFLLPCNRFFHVWKYWLDGNYRNLLPILLKLLNCIWTDSVYGIPAAICVVIILELKEIHQFLLVVNLSYVQFVDDFNVSMYLMFKCFITSFWIWSFPFRNGISSLAVLLYLLCCTYLLTTFYLWFSSAMGELKYLLSLAAVVAFSLLACFFLY